MPPNNCEQAVVKCYCNAQELIKHIKRWLKEGFKLAAVSLKSNLNLYSYTAQDIIQAVNSGVEVFFNTISSSKCVRISLIKAEEGALLPFVYVQRSLSSMNKPMRARVRTTKQNLSA